MGSLYAIATAVLEGLCEGLRMIDCEDADIHDAAKYVGGLEDRRAGVIGVAAILMARPDGMYGAGKRVSDLLDRVECAGEKGQSVLINEWIDLDEAGYPYSSGQIKRISDARRILRETGQSHDSCGVCDEERRDLICEIGSRARDYPGVAASRLWMERAIGVIMSWYGGQAVASQLGVIRRRKLRETRRAWAERQAYWDRIAAALDPVVDRYDKRTWALISDERRMRLLAGNEAQAA